MRLKKIAAGITALLCCAGMVSYLPYVGVETYAAELVNDGFEISFDGWHGTNEAVYLDAQEGTGFDGTRGMNVTKRRSESDGATSSKSFYLCGGKEYSYSVRVYSETAENFHFTLSCLDPDTQEYFTEVLDEKKVSAGEWTELSAQYAAPSGSLDFILTITTDSTSDFSFDNVLITEEVRELKNDVSAATNGGLKNAFGKYFRVGSVLNSGTVRDSSITANMIKNFNSITCENEMKPEATINRSTSSGTNIGAKLDSAAGILNFCSQNGIGVRGHTLVWHAQTPQWFFKEGFNDSGAWVSQSVMDQRLESYIKNLFAEVERQYPKLNLYAYDVANECVSDEQSRTSNNGGARVAGYGDGKSPWVQIYGSNAFLTKAFTYARQYAPEGCKLFYNDYNEYWDHKRNCIVSTCKDLYNKGILDGVGMQSHINADSSGFSGTSAYVSAMKMYSAIGCEVQATELDISTEDGKFSAQQQSDKYKAIFQAAMDINTSGSGGKVTAICVWGPNDSNTWIGSKNAPLLFDGNNQPKAAYNTLMGMVPQSDWTEYSGPVEQPTGPDDDGYYFHHTYESGVDSWGQRGGTTVASSGISAYAGEKALSVSDRTDAWNGAEYSLNSRAFKAGEAYSFSVMVMQSSGAPVDMQLSLQYTDADGETAYDHIKVLSAASGVWTQLANTTYKIPSGASSLILYVETLDSLTSFYVDEAIGAVAGTVIKATTKGSGQRGDVDNDGAISAIDVSIALRGSLKGLSDKGMAKRSDIDGDGDIKAEDISLLKQFVHTKINEFPKIVSQIDTAKMDQLFSGITPAKSYKNADENNALYTQRFGADPGFLIYKDRLYVYTTNDAFEYSNGNIQENTYAVQTINCISSTDLVNWTDHGAIPVAGNSGAAKWASRSWAPDACWKTINGQDKFFLYFADNANGIGVLTADSPEGPWRDPIGKALLNRQSPNCGNVEWMFDPGVLVDDDGTGYIYFGGGVPEGKAADPGTARCVQLGADMTSIVGTPNAINPPYLFEDSSILKIGDTYYYSFCTNFSVPGNNQYGMNSGEIGYMTSKNPLGPFTYQGIMFKNPASYSLDSGGNNHHSFINFKGSYYILYHARAIEKRMGVSLNYRSPHIDAATVSNGKITATGSMKGVSQLETLNPYTTVQAETMWRQGGINVSGLGNTVVSDIQKGDWIAVQGVNFKNGAESITVRVSSTSGAAIKICTGSPTGDVVGYVEVPATSGSYTEITAPVNDISGTNNLYFVFSGEMNFDSWSFS